jgi:hypothetical protein
MGGNRKLSSVLPGRLARCLPRTKPHRGHNPAGAELLDVWRYPPPLRKVHPGDRVSNFSGGDSSTVEQEPRINPQLDELETPLCPIER